MFNANNFYEGWEKIVYGFKNGILPVSKKNDMKRMIWENLMIFRAN